MAKLVASKIKVKRWAYVDGKRVPLPDAALRVHPDLARSGQKKRRKSA